MEKESFIFYLNDTLKQCVDRAIEIDQQKSDFDNGIAVGYYEVLSRLINQAEVFGILSELDPYLQEFDPHDLLIGKAKSPFDRRNGLGN